MQQGGVLAGYDPGSLFCEMLRPGEPSHPALSHLLDRLQQLPIEALRRRAADAERDLLERGITFTVYSDATAIDRILPFDLIPRVRALNLFLHDIYHDRKILADGVIPRELVLGNAGYSQAMVGFDPPYGTYVHVCGTDIIRDDTGRYLVLEDNARTPSGVAYVIENRHMTLRVLSDLMAGLRVRDADEYGLRLHRALAEIAPGGVSDPQVVLLSPGIFNSAYFEHVFLAREHELVVKPVAESGGYGLLIGPHATRAKLDDFRGRLKVNPANYISQPMVRLSVSPTLGDDGINPRHIDLRPFAVTGRDTWVLPGGLTRVALRAGSLVVNSSQGGGSKDTWVLA